MTQHSGNTFIPAGTNHWSKARNKLASVLAAIGLLIAAGVPVSAQSGASVITYHNDAGRTGLNSAETTLTPANVKANSFGVLTTVALDDFVDTQPLVVDDAAIQNFAPNGAVYVGTNSNTVYAIDAVTGSILKQRNLGAPIRTFGGCSGPYTGITGTPVIDLGTRTLFFMVYTMVGANPTYHLHALDLETLADRQGSPITVQATQTLLGGGSYSFNALYERQRAALLEVNGSIYVAWGSFCDSNPTTSRGWVLAWDAATLALTSHHEVTDRQPAASNTGPCAVTIPSPCFLSSIWMSGYGVAADSFGSIYFITANSASASYDSTYNLAESAIKVSADLSQTLGFFTPNNQPSLDDTDKDFGSGGLMVLPDQTGQFSRLAVAAGKDGRLFVMDRDAMGGFNIPDIPNNSAIGGCWCGPSYLQTATGGEVVSSGGSAVELWAPSVLNNLPALSLVATAPAIEKAHGTPGFFTSVSSNGTTPNTAIIWALGRAAGTDNHQTLYAYSATPSGGALPLLWSAPVGYWTVPGNHNANGVPTVANGHVYVASYAQLTILGLLTPGATATTLLANPATVLATAPVTLTATVQAQSGAAAPTGAVTFTSGSTTLGSADLVGSGTSATASITVNASLLPLGPSAVNATYTPTGNFTSSSGPAYVITQVPTQLAMTAAPSSGTAGAALGSVTVQIRDASGTLVVGSNAAVTISSTPAGVGGTLTVNAVNGIATFSNLLINTVGSYKLTAASAGLKSATSASIAIAAAAANNLQITAVPASGSAGTALSSVVVQVQDAFGNVALGSSAAVSISSTPTGVSGTLSVNAVSGVATFSNLVFSTAGNYTLTAGSNGLTGATSSSIGIIGAASKLQITSAPVSGTAGSALSSVVIQVQDSLGNLVSGSSAPVTIASTPAGVSGTLTVNAVNGVATFGNLVFNATGNYTLTASSNGLTNATSGSITIAPAATNKLQITTAPVSGTAGTALNSLVVQVQDSLGNLVSGSSAPVTIASTPAGVSGTLTVNAVNGVATFSNLVFSASGSYTLTVSSNGLTSATSGSIVVAAGVADRLQITTAPVSGTAGAALNSVLIQVQDALGNLVPGSSAPVTIVSTAAGVTGTLTVNAVNGVATFSNLVFNTTGNYTLTASSNGLTSATSGAITIAPAAANKLQVTTAPVSGIAGAALNSVLIQVQDALGNLVPGSSAPVTIVSTAAGVTGTLTVNAVNGVATFSNLVFNTTGNYTLTGSSNGLTSATSASINIAPAAANKLQITTAPVSGIAGAALSSVVVQVQDSLGNLVSGSSAPVTIVSTPTGVSGTLTVNAVNGVATFSNLVFNTTGNYTLTASSNGLTNATSGSITIAPAAANKLQITTAPVSGTAGTALNSLVVQVQDSLGNLVSGSSAPVTIASTPTGVSGTLAVNAVNGIGTFSNLVFSTSGNYTLTASSNGLTSATSASINIAPGAQTITFGPIPGVTFGVAPFGLTASASSGLDVQFASTTQGVCTVSGTTVTILTGGMCSITASQPGNANYLAAPSISQNFIVSQANQNIIFSALPGLTYGAAPFTLSATAPSGLTVAFASTTPAVCSAAGNLATVLAAGWCSIVATQTGNAAWLAANPVTQGFMVAKANPAITWPQPAAIYYGTPLSATQLNGSAGIPGAFVYSPPLGTVLPAGAGQTLGLTFTPLDTTDFNIASASTTIGVMPATASCVATLAGQVKPSAPGVPGSVQLYWMNTWSAAVPVDHYNVYRSLSPDFSGMVRIAGALSAPPRPAVSAPANPGGQLMFTDATVTAPTTYYYKVASANAADLELCGSNQIAATARAGR